jgi:large subunit ribosomal protein L6
MSRVGKNPITIPASVTINITGNTLNLKSSKGTLVHELHPLVELQQEGQVLKLTARNNSKQANALSGTHRALLNNKIIGLNEGFATKLELVGVGYRAQVQGKKLNLTLGFSHPVVFDIPSDISIESPSQTEIIVKGRAGSSKNL